MACSIDDLNGAIASQDKLFGVHFNARSLRKNSDEIRNLVALFKRKCSFIGISETWLSYNEVHSYKIPGYSIEAQCRSENFFGTAHGGTALYIDDSITYKRRCEVKFSTLCCESVWIEVDKKQMKMPQNLIVSVVYRSPSASYDHFCEDLDKIFQSFLNEKAAVIIMGDFNIDLSDITSPTCYEYVTCFTSYGFSSLVHTPTRVTSHSSTIIDRLIQYFTLYFFCIRCSYYRSLPCCFCSFELLYTNSKVFH